MSNITVRPSTKSDGETILAIMDANALWFRTIGTNQMDGELYSESEFMAEYFKGLGGVGDLLGEKGTQTFVAEIDDWEEGKTGRRVGAFYTMGWTWPKYGEHRSVDRKTNNMVRSCAVPDVEEPSLFLNNAAVHPDLRNKGMGAAMVAHAKEIASKTDAKLIRLDTYGGTLGMLPDVILSPR
jgi:hypothetical protein